MAQKVQVILVDDVDGGVAEETVTFGLDGSTYEIDLSTTHAQELRDALQRWVDSARKLSSRTSGGRNVRRARAAAVSSRATEIREWARANGYQVNDRGRISQDVQSAYDAAH